MISAMVQMTKYELIVAANAKSGESLGSKIDKALKDFSAESVKVEKLGKRTLAYPIANPGYRSKAGLCLKSELPSYARSHRPLCPATIPKHQGSFYAA